MSKERREEIKNKQINKKIIIAVSVVLAVVIAVGAAVAVNIHKCDDCGASFFGSGYYKEKEAAGVLGSLFGSFFGDTEGIQLEVEENVIICRECAMNNVSVKSELRSVDEFKR